MTVDRLRRAVTALVVAVLVAFALAAIVAPPDPFSQLRTAAAVFVAAAPLAYYAVGDLA